MPDVYKRQQYTVRIIDRSGKDRSTVMRNDILLGITHVDGRLEYLYSLTGQNDYGTGNNSHNA